MNASNRTNIMPKLSEVNTRCVHIFKNINRYNYAKILVSIDYQWLRDNS